MSKKLVQANLDDREWFIVPTAIAAYSIDGESVLVMLQSGVVMTVVTDDPNEFVKKSLRYRKQYEEEIDSESAIDFQYGDLFE